MKSILPLRIQNSERNKQKILNEIKQKETEEVEESSEEVKI